MDEKQIEKLMTTLDLSREDAIQLMEDDKAIDRGAKMFDLDPELEKGAKKARQADRKKNTTTKREKKADDDKATIMETLIGAIENLDCVDGLNVANAEREMTFNYNSRKFKVVLSAPRT